MCLRVCYVYVCVAVRGEDSFVEPVLSFNLYVSSRDLNSGRQTWTAIAYTCWAILLVQRLNFKPREYISFA